MSLARRPRAGGRGRPRRALDPSVRSPARAAASSWRVALLISPPAAALCEAVRANTAVSKNSRLDAVRGHPAAALPARAKACSKRLGSTGMTTIQTQSVSVIARVIARKLAAPRLAARGRGRPSRASWRVGCASSGGSAGMRVVASTGRAAVPAPARKAATTGIRPSGRARRAWQRRATTGSGARSSMSPRSSSGGAGLVRKRR